MNLIFNIVAVFLQLIAYATGLTYKEINIITYFILVPFVYIALVDKIIRKHWLKIVFGLGVISLFLKVRNFREFSEWLFDKSVLFLLSFREMGWNYVVASVIICVVLPGLLFVILFYYAFKQEIKHKLKVILNK